MKKILFILSCFISFILVTGCSEKEPQKETINVLMPAGGPTLSLIQVIHEVHELNGNPIKYEVTDLPDELPSAITSKDYDIVVAPTNLGANLYNKGSNYVYAGAVTFGNLYVVGKNESSIDNLNKQTIAAFGEGSIPQILLEKILVNKGFKIVDTIDASSTDKQIKIEYFDSVSNANAQFMSGTYSYALLAEPVLSVAKSKNNQIKTVIDLQTEYKNLTGKDSYPQAGLFINIDLIGHNKKFVTAFLDKVEAGTTFVNTHKEDAASYYTEEKELITAQFSEAILTDAISRSNIRFESSKDSKDSLNEFLQMIYDFKPALIGNKLPDDSFYMSK